MDMHMGIDIIIAVLERLYFRITALIVRI